MRYNCTLKTTIFTSQYSVTVNMRIIKGCLSCIFAIIQAPTNSCFFMENQLSGLLQKLFHTYRRR